VYGSFAAFSWVPLKDNWINHAPNFVCLLYKTRPTSSSGGDTGSTSDWSYGHECFPLTFHDQAYWKIDDEDKKWAWPIRLACLIAIFTAIAGGLATVLLWSATCFSLPPRTIQKIAGVFSTCAPLSLLTLIAGAASLCRRDYPSDDPNLECERNGSGVRLEYGGTTMIFVSFFYMAAGLATLVYHSAVMEEEEDDDTTDPEASSDKHETVPLMQPITCTTTIKHTPEGTVTTKETTNPDGSKTVEIIQDDTLSPPSSPSRKSPRRSTKKKSPKLDSAGISGPPLEEYIM
jgi:hypothetical protein